MYGVLVDTPTHDALEHPIRRIEEAAQEAKGAVADPEDFLSGVKTCGLVPEECTSCQ